MSAHNRISPPMALRQTGGVASITNMAAKPKPMATNNKPIGA